MSDKKKDTKEKEESSEDVLARLEAMSASLSGIGDYTEEAPELEVIQTHPILDELLWIDETPVPNVWIPDYHSLLRYHERYVSDCDSVSPTGWKCTQKPSRCREGYAHFAGLSRENQWDRTKNTKFDMVTAIWGGNTGHSLWINGIDHHKVMRSIRPGFANYVDSDACGLRSPHSDQTGHGWVCSMPAGHVYDHIACDNVKVLEVWKNAG